MSFWDKLTQDWDTAIEELATFWNWFDTATDWAMIPLILIGLSAFVFPFIEEVFIKNFSEKTAARLNHYLVISAFFWIIGSFVFSFVMFAN